MGLLDLLGLGSLKLFFIIASWTSLILLTIFVPFAFIFTVPAMLFMPFITALLFVKRRAKVPEGCLSIDGKIECKAKGI